MFDLYQKYFENIWAPEKNSISVFQSIVLSWPFILMSLIVEFFLTFLYLDQVTRGSIFRGDILSAFSGSTLQAGSLLLFIKTFFYMITFPMWSFFSYYFWKVGLNFSIFIFNYDTEQGSAQKIASASLSSHAFSCIPVIGAFFQSITQFIILFNGTKSEITGGSGVQSFLILITPIFIWGAFIFGSIVLVALGVSQLLPTPL
jgi:hypothetical protein